MTGIRSLCYKPFFRRPVIADWARVVPDSVYGVSASGLVGWWKFEEEAGDTVYDISGEGNHGTIYGAQRVSGKVGRALAFDGTDDCVDVAHNASLIPTAITVAAWVKFDDTYRRPVVTKGGDSTDYERYYLGTGSNNQAMFVTKSSEGQNSAETTWAPSTGVWYHLVGTYDNTGIKIFVNGQLEGTGAMDYALPSSTDPLYIGRALRFYGGRYTPGTIDEVIIFSRALTAEELKRIYEATRAVHR